MKIELIRERRKTISLKIVDENNATLKVPKNMSDKKIQEFLDSKNNWIGKTVQKLKDKEDFSHSFDLDKYIYLNGKPVMPVKEVSIGFENLSEYAKKKEIKKYYLSMFSKLEQIAEECSAQTGLKYDEIRVLNSIRVWGSYNTKKQMKLNYKLVLLPEKLVYYVVCHELCHSMHMNHKPQFWDTLGHICPDYKSLKKELEKYSFILRYNFE